MSPQDERSRSSTENVDEVSGDGPQSLSKLIYESAIEAEFETGKHEESLEEAKRNVFKRVLRMIAGFTLIAIGLALLVLPGSGWLFVILGLGLLPFAWAERTVRLIRQKIPGIPEEGRIPPSTWVILGTTMIAFMALSILFGDDVTSWTRSLGDPERLFG